MLFESDAPRRRRATSEKYVEIHNARSLVRDSQRALDQWQRKVARLRALMMSRKGDIEQVKLEAAQLLPLVVASRIDLERAIDAADPKLARHSLVRDIENAFVRLEEDLILLSSPEAAKRWDSEIPISP